MKNKKNRILISIMAKHKKVYVILLLTKSARFNIANLFLYIKKNKIFWFFIYFLFVIVLTKEIKIYCTIKILLKEYQVLFVYNFIIILICLLKYIFYSYYNKCGASCSCGTITIKLAWLLSYNL